MTSPTPPVHSKGFTLIETLIYIGLFGVILTSVLLAAYPLLTGAENLNQRVTEEVEAAFVFRKIASVLFTEEIIDIDESNPDFLIIRQADDDRISFGLIPDSETIGIFNNDEPPVLLTASRAKFSNFSASYTDSAGGNMPHTVAVSFDVGGETYSRTYHVYFN